MEYVYSLTNLITFLLTHMAFFFFFFFFFQLIIIFKNLYVYFSKVTYSVRTSVKFWKEESVGKLSLFISIKITQLNWCQVEGSAIIF